jgi:tellurium resistance protein TerD
MADKKESKRKSPEKPKAMHRTRTMLNTVEEAKAFLGGEPLTEKRRRTQTQVLSPADEPEEKKKSPKKRKSPAKSPGTKKGRKANNGGAAPAPAAAAAPASASTAADWTLEAPVPEVRTFLKRGDSFVMEGSLGRVVLGLGWDSPFDLDASCIVYSRTKAHTETIDYTHLRSNKYNIQHSGDILRGKTEGTLRDDEKIFVELSTLPDDVGILMFTVNVYSSDKTFAEVKNAYVRLIDADKKEERCLFKIDSSFGTNTGLIMCKVFRVPGETQWRLMPIGEGTSGRRAPEMLPHMAKYIQEDFVPEGCTITVLN